MPLPSPLRRAGPARREQSPSWSRLIRVATLDGPLDPELVQLRGSLLPFRRRLWVRRLVRRGWIALAAVVVAELVLWTVARFMPARARAGARRGDPARRAPRLADRRRAGPATHRRDGAGRRRGRRARRPGLERARTGRRVPGLGRPAPTTGDDAPDGRGALDEAAETDRFVRRQRRDAVALDRAWHRGPVPAALLAPARDGRARRGCSLLVPVILPEPAGRRDRPAAAGPRGGRPPGRGDRPRRRRARDKGAGADDPRTRLAQELRDLARQLRERPDDLDANLARLGAIETDVRAQVDPANEQRAASLTRSAARSRAPRPASPTRTATATRRRRGTTSRSSATSSTR